MEFQILATGSTGNAVQIEKKILVDCGVPYKTIEPVVNDLRLVLLTHSHLDHFKSSTIRRLALEKPLMRFGCGPFLVKNLLEAGVPERQIDVLEPRVMYGYGVCNIIPFPLLHDVPNYGYKIHFPHGKVFYATDTRSLQTVSAIGYDLYLVECNYKEEELKARMDEKMSNGEFAYEQRVIKNHLSDRRVNNWLYKNMGPKGEYVYLHQHIDRGKDEGKNTLV